MPPKAPPGRKSWPPKKLEWLETYQERWETAKRDKTTTTYYDNMTTAFIARYGYDLPLEVDPEVEPVKDVLETVQGSKYPGTAGLSAEEMKEKVGYYKSLRRVRSHHEKPFLSF